MNDFSVVMFVPDIGEFVDLTKYDVCDVIDRGARRIVGKVFINKETGKEEYVQFRNGKVRKLPEI